MTARVRVCVLVLAGAAQALLLPPFGAWWLAPAVFVALLWALEGLRGRRAFLSGWLAGASSVVALGAWLAPTVVRFGGLPWPVGIAALGAYALVFGAYVGGFAMLLPILRRSCGAWMPFATAAAWVACEWLNPQLFAHHLGLAVSATPRLFLLTALTGVAGPGFLLVAAGALLFEALRTRRLVPAPALAFAALVAGALVYTHVRAGAIARAEADAPSHRLALVQDALDVDARTALARRGDDATALAMVASSQAALAADPEIDVLVWAEGALPGTPAGANGAAVRALVRTSGVELWTGGHAWDESGARRYNAAFRVHGDGVIDPPYRKNVLVPFGEYMPLGDELPFLRRLWSRPRNFPGDLQPIFATAAGNVAFLICYEAIKSGYVRGLVQRPVDLLVNLTYDGWFGDSSCPHLHLAAAALQSAQLGVPMARVSSTGISAFIDARGAITARTALYARTVLVGDVARASVASPYRTLGDWFAWACVTAVALLTALCLRTRAA